VQNARNRLIQRRDLTKDEAGRIYTCWYPLARTEQQEALEEQEDFKAFDSPDDATQENDDEEIRPEAEGNERE